MMITSNALQAPEARSFKLTDRQREILELIQQAIETSGAPPTRAEIARTLGFKSANAAEEHLQALARKGVIDLVGGTSRGIRLNKGPLRDHGLLRQQGLPLASLDQLCLPLVGKVSAGRPLLAQEHIEHHYSLDMHMFAERPDYLLTVRGMSMRDAGIMEGDLLAVKLSKEARNGQIVVARLGEDVTVKRFKRDGDRIDLIPENPAFKTLTISDTSQGELTIEGVVVGLIRKGF